MSWQLPCRPSAKREQIAIRGEAGRRRRRRTSRQANGWACHSESAQSWQINARLRCTPELIWRRLHTRLLPTARAEREVDELTLRTNTLSTWDPSRSLMALARGIAWALVATLARRPPAARKRCISRRIEVVERCTEFGLGHAPLPQRPSTARAELLAVEAIERVIAGGAEQLFCAARVGILGDVRGRTIPIRDLKEIV